MALFFCRFSSRLFLRSSTMLVSLFLRASSVSIPFLKPFLRRSELMLGNLGGPVLLSNLLELGQKLPVRGNPIERTLYLMRLTCACNLDMQGILL